MVPRPQIVDPGSYIYLPFNIGVWIAYIVCLVATSFIIHYFVKREFIRATELSSLEVIFLEVINIATSHGATRFPRQVPVRILLVSWTAISLLISTAYCTGYTSLLATPRFSKPIDTIADFLEQGELEMLNDLHQSQNRKCSRINPLRTIGTRVFHKMNNCKVEG